MTEHKFASFKVRLLASLLDGIICAVLLALGAVVAASQPNLQQAINTLFLLFILLLNPLVVYSHILFTRYWGATPGKLLTGLRVVTKDTAYLSMKRVFFRQTVGYTFSWIFFGLGYLAIIKDEKKQGWHDKTVGSYVVVKDQLFIVGLAAFFILATASISLLNIAVNKFSQGPLAKEWQTIQTQMEEEEKLREEQKRMRDANTPSMYLQPTGSYYYAPTEKSL